MMQKLRSREVKCKEPKATQLGEQAWNSCCNRLGRQPGQVLSGPFDRGRRLRHGYEKGMEESRAWLRVFPALSVTQ